MANRYGYTPILLFCKGADLTRLEMSPDKLTVRPVKSAIESTSKTGQLTEMSHETIGGRYYYEFTIEGELSPNNQSFLQYFQDKQDVTELAESYTIFRHYSATSADYLGKAYLRTYKLTGETNGIWRYEITGWAMEYLENEDVSVALDYPDYPTITADDYAVTPYLFGNTTIAELTSTTWDSAFNIELNMEFTFDDEKFMFANNNDLQTVSNNKFSGTLSFGTEYVVGKELDVDDLYDGSATSGICEFAITDGLTPVVNQIVIISNGVISEYNRPDPDRQLYESSVTVRLQGWYDSGTYTQPIDITLT